MRKLPDLPPLDLPVLRWLDRQVPRFQNATGIPRWRVGLNLWGLFGALLGLSLVWSDTRWYWLILAACEVGVNLFAATFVSFRAKYWQDLADLIGLPIPNPLMHEFSWSLVRISCVCFLNGMNISMTWFLHHGAALHDWLRIVGILSFCAYVYVDSVNTYPMQGPSLKDRIKGWFQRKPVLKPAREGA